MPALRDKIAPWFVVFQRLGKCAWYASIRMVIPAALAGLLAACGTGGHKPRDTYAAQVLPRDIHLSTPASLRWRDQITEQQAIRFLMQMVAETEWQALEEAVPAQEPIRELSAEPLQKYPPRGYRGLAFTFFTGMDEPVAVARIALTLLDFLIVQLCFGEENCSANETGMNLTYTVPLLNTFDDILREHNLTNSSIELPSLGHTDTFTISIEDMELDGYRYKATFNLPPFLDEHESELSYSWSQGAQSAAALTGLAAVERFAGLNLNGLYWFKDGSTRTMVTQTSTESDNGLSTTFSDFIFEQGADGSMVFQARISQNEHNDQIRYEWLGMGNHHLAFLSETIDVEFNANSPETPETENPETDNEANNENNEGGTDNANLDDGMATEGDASNAENELLEPEREVQVLSPSSSYRMVVRTVMENEDISSQYYCIVEADGVSYECGDYPDDWAARTEPSAFSTASASFFENQPTITSVTVVATGAIDLPERLYLYLGDNPVCIASISDAEQAHYTLKCWIEDALAALEKTNVFARDEVLDELVRLTSIRLEPLTETDAAAAP